MKPFEIITVATHDEGTYHQLIQNPYYSNIIVLGYGKHWEGFMMKYRLVYEFIQDKEDELIVVFLDGFDSLITRDPKEAIQHFLDQDKKVLYSVDKIANPIQGFIYNRVFHSDDNPHHLNSGMYIGYVKYLKLFLKEVLTSKYTSDQKATIELFHQFDFVGTDENEDIFRNKLMQRECVFSKEDPPFVSFPGMLTSNRLYRSVFEYSQYFIDIHVLFFLAVSSSLYMNRLFIPLSLFAFFYGVLFSSMDKSSFYAKGWV